MPTVTDNRRSVEILIVDDEAETRDSCRKVLSRAGRGRVGQTAERRSATDSAGTVPNFSVWSSQSCTAAEGG